METPDHILLPLTSKPPFHQPRGKYFLEITPVLQIGTGGELATDQDSYTCYFMTMMMKIVPVKAS
jgi:hypothetical protein